jgi:hypothetical protein
MVYIMVIIYSNGYNILYINGIYKGNHEITGNHGLFMGESSPDGPTIQVSEIL